MASRLGPQEGLNAVPGFMARSVDDGADPVGLQVLGGIWLEQLQEGLGISYGRGKPQVELFGIEDHRHPLMEGAD